MTLERTYTIRQLCREFGVTPRALRFYEDKGLLSPGRNGVNRVYSPRDRTRLLLIMRCKRVGFSLADIREMLDLYDADDMQVTQMAVSVRKFRKRIEELEAQKVDVEIAIATLKITCTAIETQLSNLRPDLLEPAPAKSKKPERLETP